MAVEIADPKKTMKVEMVRGKVGPGGKRLLPGQTVTIPEHLAISFLHTGAAVEAGSKK